MLRALSPVLAALFVFIAPTIVVAADEEDFISFAGEHCRAFVSEGRADMSFALGKAASKFSQKEMLEFNRDFARKIINEYNIDPSKSCVVDVLSMKPVPDTSSKPPEKGRYATAKPQREIAVVAGVLGTNNSDAPVSVAYRFERTGSGPWVINNITFNGHPMVDRYRVEYEALARKGGSDAVLENI